MPLDLSKIRFEISRREPQFGFQLVDQFAQQQQIKAGDGEAAESRVKPQPLGPLEFHLVQRDQDGEAVPIEPAWEMRVQRNSSAVYVFTGVIRAPQAAAPWKLQPGRYVMRISSDYYRTITTETLEIPGDPGRPLQEFPLRPNHAYPFASGGSPRGGDRPTLIRGSLHQPNGTPVEGGIVRAEIEYPRTVDREPRDEPWSATYETEFSGEWVLAVPDAVFPSMTSARRPGAFPKTTANITIRYPGGVDGDPVPLDIEQWKTTTLPTTSLRGRVENATGLPIAGATVTVRDHPDQTTSGANGEWSYYFRFGSEPGEAVDVTASVSGQPSQTQTVEPSDQIVFVFD